jgi:hypothetical protein
MQMVAMGGTADICIRLHQLLLLPLQEVKANGPNNIRIDILSVPKRLMIHKLKICPLLVCMAGSIYKFNLYRTEGVCIIVHSFYRIIKYIYTLPADTKV